MLDGSVDILKMLCGPACAVPGTTLKKSAATDAMSDKVDALAIELLQRGTTALSGAVCDWPRPKKGRSRGSSIAAPSVIACAPPTITIVETAEAALEMTAMETMTAAVAASKAAPVTPPAHAAPTVAATAHAATAVAATATATHQDQRTARCTRTQLLGVAGISRQSRQCSDGGKNQHKSANKTRGDKTAFHDCVPFVGYVAMELSEHQSCLLNAWRRR